MSLQFLYGLLSDFFNGIFGYALYLLFLNSLAYYSWSYPKSPNKRILEFVGLYTGLHYGGHFHNLHLSVLLIALFIAWYVSSWVVDPENGFFSRYRTFSPNLGLSQ